MIVLLTDALCIKPKPTKHISTSESHNVCDVPKRISEPPSIAAAI